MLRGVCILHAKWVSVTAAWRVLSQRMEDDLQIKTVAVNRLNRQSQITDK